MVKTRRMARNEQEQNALDVQSEKPAAKSPVLNVKLPQRGCESENHNLKMAARTSTSSAARRAQLEYEAAKQKAEIDKHLIEKKLEADIAALASCSGSVKSQKQSDHVVEEWLERSHSHQNTRAPSPPAHSVTAPPHAGMHDLHDLSSALRNIIADSNREKNSAMLTRLAIGKDLPLFSGDPLEFLQFKESFNESTRICNYTDSENVCRLRKCLRGEAKDTVAALLIGKTTPFEIIEALELRYGRPELILHNLLRKMKKIAPLPTNYHCEIVNFSIKIKNYVAAVRAIKASDYLRSPEMLDIILTKCPSTLITKWSDYSYIYGDNTQKSKLELFADFIHDEAMKTAAAGLSHIHTESYKKKEVGNRTVCVTQDNNNCSFCRGDPHPLPECTRFKRALRKDRWRFIKGKRLCYRCMDGRHNKDTCEAPLCDVDGCGLPHHKMLHWKKPDQSVVSSDDKNKYGQSSEMKVQSETVAIVENPSRVLLKVVPINLHGPLGIVSTYAMLDDGATVSLILSSLADAVGITGQASSLRLRGAFNSELNCDCEIINCIISNKNNVKFNFKARKISELDLPLQKLSVVNKNKYSYLNEIENLYCCVNVKPTVLIGQDNFHLIVPNKTILGNKNQPAATLTPLGWCVHGVVSAHSSVPRSSISTISSIEEDILVTTPTSYDHPADPDAELNELVRHSFTFESIGVHNKPRQNAKEVRAVAILEETSRLVDGRWEVGLPWKGDDPMPDSYPNAHRRLKSVEKRIHTDKEYGDRYRERINHLFINNYARQVTDSEPGNRTWYLPHFGVDNPNKSKLRVVFDAAAPSSGKNLNFYLLQGPDLLESLLGIMFKFREEPVALMGDIKDMFLCIKIRKEDQKALQFLWREDPANPIKVYAMTSLIFGANCSPFIAQYIKNKNAQRFSEEMPEAVNAILKSHYMDDYIDSLRDVTTAKQMKKEITDIHHRGGFVIRNWVSNAPQVLEEMPNETKTVQFNINNNQPERTLGLLWFPPEDTLSIDVTLKRIPSEILNERKPTKREMLRIIMSILDIYGFLNPITIKAKILMRETWKNNMKWDDELTEDLNTLFRAWVQEITEAKNLKIPRWYFNRSVCSTSEDASGNETATLELHVFCDGSSAGYATVAFWRRTYREGQVTVAFVASKCRVVPIKKPVSVPRVELQGATLAVRLANTIKKEHRIIPTATYYWTDSMTVLHWIRNECRNYKVFVANRLGEIDESSNKLEWFYVPTHKNIADIATKSCNYKLHEECEWFRGPNFLYEDPATWNFEPGTENIKLNEQDLEIVHMITNDNNNSLPVPDPTRFSSWLRLLRSTARVLQFIEKCRKRPAELNAELLKKAEQILIKFSQVQSFPRELKMLQNKENIPRDSRLRALTPIIDKNGLLRVGGRINAAKDVNVDLKEPVILDGSHPMSKLIVKSYHETAAHGSTEMIVNELRQKYWIINMRPTVRNVAAKCLHCRIRKAMPQPPRLGDLPEERIAHHSRPFTNCGVDLFGPMVVAIGRRKEKRYGVLFTCLTVRAVHIEMVQSLTADSMIMAIRRMAAKRGWPAKFWSDNGTNLKGADAELKKSYLEVVNDKGLHEKLTNKLVEWNFLSPGTPHMGGAWERLIRSVKTALKVILKERTPQEETLLTLLAEVENMINSRPLTHVSVDHRDEEALTPNHFLLGSSSNLPPLGSFSNDEFYLKKQWRIAQRLADMFWRRWVKEVLPVLLPRKKWQDEAPALKKGDVVLIMDPNGPRNTWPRGVIEKTYPGRDGRIRVVDVKTKSGIFRRPVIKILFLLPIDECHGRDTGREDIADAPPEP